MLLRPTLNALSEVVVKSELFVDQSFAGGRTCVLKGQPPLDVGSLVALAWFTEDDGINHDVKPNGAGVTSGWLGADVWSQRLGYSRSQSSTDLQRQQTQ